MKTLSRYFESLNFISVAQSAFIYLVLYFTFSVFAGPLSLNSLEPGRSLLLMGGSFSPPTISHMVLMAETMYEQEMPHGIFLVADPYKPGATSAEVSLKLTQISVDNFDYILRMRNIPHRDFKRVGPGKVTWISLAGRSVILEVSSFDIDNKIRNTIDSLRHFSALVGPRNLWWLSGGDSSASMPTWGSWWQEMFAHSNMIFVDREGTKGGPTIDSNIMDPLRSVYPDSFLKNYRYDKIDHMHQYSNLNPNQPSIFVIKKRILPFSSTLVRDSLVTDSQKEAQLMLSPAVYREIITNKFYSSAREYLTRENLVNFLRDEFLRIEQGHADSVLYGKMMEELISEIKETGDQAKYAVSVIKAERPESEGLILDPLNLSSKWTSIISLRNQLLLGDPRFLVGRVGIQNGFSISDQDKILFNLVISQDSLETPLVIRQANDRKNVWHDLNITTNELRSSLVDPSLGSEIASLFGGSPGVYANALFTAVQMDTTAKQRFEIFSGRRYFTRLALGAVRAEFVSELTRSERQFLNWSKREILLLRNEFTDAEILQIGETLSDLYIVSRFAQLRPELLSTERFWQNFLDAVATGYPGERIDIEKANVQRILALRLLLLGRAIRFSKVFISQNNESLKITYRGKLLGELDGKGIYLRGPLERFSNILLKETTRVGLKRVRLIAGLRKYFLDILKPDANLTEDNPYQHRPSDKQQSRHHNFAFLPYRELRSTPDQNLIRDIHFFFKDILRELASIEETFLSIKDPLSTNLMEFRSQAISRMRKLKVELESLEENWLRQKIASPFEVIDARLSKYPQFLEAYLRIKSEFMKALDEMRTINHVGLGISSKLNDFDSMTSRSLEAKGTFREFLWREIIGDILDKYIVSNISGPLGASKQRALDSLRKIPFSELEAMKLREVIFNVVKSLNESSSEMELRPLAENVYKWLNQKYGLIDEVILRPMSKNEVEGSYQIMALDNIYFTESASHHPLFDPTLPSSLPNLPAYIERKWGGLKNIAQAERVVFSKLGTFETLFSLRNQGFSSFFQVNSPYGMRGSKTLLAFQPDRADPLVVFYSFIGEDLFHHKLMQLAIDFGESFRKVRILTSHGLKSWDQAQAVVAEAIANLPSIPIDDLVLGYGEIANQFLNNSQYVKLIQAGSMGEFAEVSYFTVVGKNGLQRNVLVISKIAYRYFGKSVLPLIQPFLEKGVDRVIFAGSAGVLDDKIPQHSLIVPRTFSLLSDSDEVTRHFELYNDFYDLAPYGEVYSGAHISVASPLIESQPRIRKMRDEFKIMSVDVEGAQIAALIQHHNRQTSASKPPVRFASAYIATDVPHTGEKSQPTFGLHDPNFIGKSQAKLRYISLLKLLWDIPSKLKHSAHASLIAKFFGEQIEGLNLSSNTIEDYRNLWREIYLRHKESFQLSMEGGRVSQGLVRVYGDLLSWLERKAPTAFRDNEELEFSVGKSNGEPNESAKKNTSVSDDVARTIILLSLLRSSTLNSGDVVYNRGKISSDIVQKNAEKGALEAVDWIFAHRNEDLEVSDILELHSVLTKDVLPLTYRGKIVEFSYLDSFGNTIQSNELILEFLVWFRQVTPSYETAIECFHRYEAIHPHKDGNGRMAELLAQSLLVRGKLAPLLFPNRFDIDYILSLRRNGGTSALNVSFVEGLVRDTNMFIAQLLKSYGEFGSDNLKFEYDSQDLIVTAGFDRSIRIQTYYLSDHSFKLERESREFIDEGFAEVKKPGVEITRRQYRVIYAFMPEAKFEMTHDSVLGGPSCRENIVKGEN